MKKQSFFLAPLAIALLALASCSSVPKAPDYNKLADSHDMRFVGEWKFMFSDDGQTVTYEDAKQLNGFNAGTTSWTRASGD